MHGVGEYYIRGSEDRVSEEQEKANVEKHSGRECVSMKDIMRKQQQLNVGKCIDSLFKEHYSLPKV